MGLYTHYLFEHEIRSLPQRDLKPCESRNSEKPIEDFLREKKNTAIGQTTTQQVAGWGLEIEQEEVGRFGGGGRNRFKMILENRNQKYIIEETQLTSLVPETTIHNYFLRFSAVAGSREDIKFGGLRNFEGRFRRLD